MKKTAKVTIAAIAVISALASSAHAWEVSGDIAIVSDYQFRGVSQTEEAPALQGGLTLSSESGFYVSVWGSNVDFLTEGTLELDVLLGWSGAISEEWSVDVGVMRYGYPNTAIPGSNFYELYAAFSWKDLTLGLAYSDDYYGNSGSFLYTSAGYSYPLLDNLSLDMHIGYNNADDSDASYTDWSIGLSTEVLGVGLSFSYVDTDIDNNYLADRRFIFALSKSF